MTSIRHTKPRAVIPEDAFLDAARDAILAVGWSRTTLTEIARRAGTSRMTLYRRWPDTRALLADLMTREWTEAVVTFDEDAGSDDPDDLDEEADELTAIVDGVVATVRALRANELLGRITDVDPELLLPYLLKRSGRSQELVVDLLAERIRAGQRAGVVRLGAPLLLARSVVLAAHGFALSAHTMLPDGQGRDADLSAFDAELARIVESYLQP